MDEHHEQEAKIYRDSIATIDDKLRTFFPDEADNGNGSADPSVSRRSTRSTTSSTPNDGAPQSGKQAKKKGGRGRVGTNKHTDEEQQEGGDKGHKGSDEKRMEEEKQAREAQEGKVQEEEVPFDETAAEVEITALAEALREAESQIQQHKAQTLLAKEVASRAKAAKASTGKGIRRNRDITSHDFTSPPPDLFVDVTSRNRPPPSKPTKSPRPSPQLMGGRSVPSQQQLYMPPSKALAKSKLKRKESSSPTIPKASSTTAAATVRGLQGKGRAIETTVVGKGQRAPFTAIKRSRGKDSYRGRGEGYESGDGENEDGEEEEEEKGAGAGAGAGVAVIGAAKKKSKAGSSPPHRRPTTSTPKKMGRTVLAPSPGKHNHIMFLIMPQISPTFTLHMSFMENQATGLQMALTV